MFFLALSFLIGSSAWAQKDRAHNQLDSLVKVYASNGKLPHVSKKLEGFASNSVQVASVKDTINMGQKAWLIRLSIPTTQEGNSIPPAIRITPGLGWCEIVWNTTSYEIVPWTIAGGVLRLKAKENLTFLVK